MPTPLREAAVAAIAATLAAAMPAAPVERNRRSPVDVDDETLPRFVIRDGAHQVLPSDAHGLTLYRVEVLVEGWARAESDAALGAALHAAHAVVVAALCNGEIEIDGGRQAISPEEVAFEAEPIPVRDAARPALSFDMRIAFNLRVPDLGGPYTTT